MSNLTDRIITILSDGLQMSIDIWDALGDANVRLADVRAELAALSIEGRIVADENLPGPTLYRLPAQAVAP